MGNRNYTRVILAMLLLPLTFCFTNCKKSAIPGSDDQTVKPSGTTSKLKAAATAENAAPSEHVFFTFPSNGIVKLQKVKIVQSNYATYFSVHNYIGGYCGFQQTPDNSFGASNILISSLWDTNTAAGIHSSPSYLGAGTVASRFGGEGDGTKTINPYNWKLNTWYNFAVRFWKIGGNIYVATFVQDLSTGNWFHTSTITRPDSGTSLGNGGDAFLEDWDSYTYDGRYKRKMFLKDFWNLNLNNVWEKHSSRYFSANANDAGRNGIYDRAFNAGYDANEDAYFMEHGANTTPDAAFGSGRTLALPAQTNQGSAPVLTVGAISSVNAIYAGGTTSVNWSINSTKSPQYSSKVEIINSSGTVVNTSDVVQPERRSVSLTQTLPDGNYTARVTITDIFNQVSASVTGTFIASSNPIANGTYRLTNLASGMSLDNMGLSSNGSGVAIYSTNNGNNQKWVLTFSNGYYRIQSVSNGLSLDSGNNTADNSSIIQYTNNSGTNQQWTLVPVGGGYYEIVNRTNGKAMDTAGATASGSFLKFWTVTNSNNQKWTITP